MNPLFIGPLVDIAKGLLARFFPDPVQKAEAELKLMQMVQTGELAQLAAETDLAKLQIQANLEEAKSTNLFVSGWRPSVGWVASISLAYVALLEPLMRFVAQVVFAYSGGFPIIDTTITLQILLGLLGIGAMRSYDKKNGTAKE